MVRPDKRWGGASTVLSGTPVTLLIDASERCVLPGKQQPFGTQADLCRTPPLGRSFADPDGIGRFRPAGIQRPQGPTGFIDIVNNQRLRIRMGLQRELEGMTQGDPKTEPATGDAMDPAEGSIPKLRGQGVNALIELEPTEVLHAGRMASDGDRNR